MTAVMLWQLISSRSGIQEPLEQTAIQSSAGLNPSLQRRRMLKFDVLPPESLLMSFRLLMVVGRKHSPIKK